MKRLFASLGTLFSETKHDPEPPANTKFVRSEEPETIIVSSSLAAAHCQKIAKRFKYERDMIDQMNEFCKNELQRLLDQVLANTTYHYTMFDANDKGPFQWVRVRELRCTVARALWNCGFYMSGGMGQYGRTVIHLRTPDMTTKTWKDFIRLHTEMDATKTDEQYYSKQ